MTSRLTFGLTWANSARARRKSAACIAAEEQARLLPAGLRTPAWNARWTSVGLLLADVGQLESTRVAGWATAATVR